MDGVPPTDVGAPAGANEGTTQPAPDLLVLATGSTPDRGPVVRWPVGNQG